MTVGAYRQGMRFAGSKIINENKGGSNMAAVRIGVLGVWRGMEYIRQFLTLEETEVVAVCDQDPERLKDARDLCGDGAKYFTDYGTMLDSGIDAVVLCNYFHEHAPYAIRALKAGKHVLSETQTAVTLKECAELVDAV